MAPYGDERLTGIPGYCTRGGGGYAFEYAVS
jgi:hypothetical protein